MKTLVALLCSLFCLALGSLALSADLPHGVKIVYSDGSSVMSYNPENKVKENQTAGFTNTAVNVFAESENGKCLVYLSPREKKLFAKETGKPGETYFIGNKRPRYLSKEILEGKPRAVKNTPILFDKKGKPVISKTGAWQGATNPVPGIVFVEKDFPVPGNIQNLTVSPDGTMVAYEFQATGLAYIPVSKGDPSQVVHGNSGTDKYLPVFDHRQDSCIAVNVLNVFAQQNFSEERMGWSGGISDIMFGNVAFYTPLPHLRLASPNPKVEHYLHFYQGSPFSIYKTASHTGVIKPLGVDSPSFQYHLKNYTIKRNARFPAFSKLANWQKGEKLLAVIYQTEGGWNSIEICDLDIERSASSAGASTKPGIYEIPVMLRSCEGMAWKPDGSLTFLSEGKLFSFDGDQIRKGINASGITEDEGERVTNREVAMRLGKKYELLPKIRTPKVPYNNVLRLEPMLVDGKILGNRLYWLTDSTFLVRGYDGYLYVWNNGNTEKFSSAPISEYYAYCKEAIPPNRDAIVPEVIPTPAPSKVIGLVPELIPTPEGIPIPNGQYPEMKNSGEVVIELEKIANIGSLRLLWKSEAPEKIILFADSGEISINKRAVPFVIMQEKDIDTVLNPVEYRLVEDESNFGIETGVGKLMLFKTESEFVLAQLVKMDNGKLIVKYKVRPYQLVKTAQR